MGHLEGVDAAIALANGGMSKLEADKVEKHLQTLAQHGVDVPTACKHELVAKRIATWHASPNKEHDIDAIMHAIIPWHDIPDDDDDTGWSAPVFDTMNPRASAIPGSPAEKGAMFKDTVINAILVPSLKGCASNPTVHLGMLMAILKHFTAIGNIDDAYGPLVSDMMLIVKVCASILKGSFVLKTSERDIEVLMSSATRKSTKSAKSIIAHTIQMSQFLETKLSYLHKYATSTRENMPAIEKAMSALEKVPKPYASLVELRGRWTWSPRSAVRLPLKCSRTCAVRQCPR